MTKEKELTQVTNELLERTNILRENGKKSMMKGEVNVLRGIIIFEVILKEINPEVMDDAEINVVKNYINVQSRQSRLRRWRCAGSGLRCRACRPCLRR